MTEERHSPGRDGAGAGSSRPTVVFFSNTSWYLWNFRLPLLRAMRDKGWEVIAVAPRDRWSPRLEEEGFRYEAMEIARKGMNPLTDLGLLLRIVRLYRKLRPALVHHFTIKPVIYGSLAATIVRVPAVVNAITGLGFMFISNSSTVRVARFVVRRLYRFVLSAPGRRAIFQNGDDLETFVAERLVRRDVTRLIRSSGVDLSRFAPSPRSTARTTFVLCSRMLYDKGVGELVEAARMLRQRGVDVEVVLAGTGDEGNPASVPDATLAKWNAEGVVRWIGHCEDVPALLRTAHAAVLPSYREGVPKGLIEAAAAGLPLVATDVPGCREVVREGINGILVPPRDSSALADAIERLAIDRDLRNRMGRESRRIAEEEFAVERVNAATMDVYREIMALERG